MPSAFLKLTAKNTQTFVCEGELEENLEGARKIETILYCFPSPKHSSEFRMQYVTR
jgi:hypothetical protein